MTIEQKLEKIESQLEELKHSRLPYPDARFQVEANDEINLRELWNVLWEGKWIVIGVTFVFAVVSVLYALSLPNIYRSEALLAPAEENSGGGLAGMASSLGGLASLTGVNIKSGSDKTTIAIAVLKSREFISKFIERHKLLVPLMAFKGWDRSQGKLIINEEIYDEDEKKWMFDFESSSPSLQEAYRKIIRLINVSVDDKTNLITLSVEHFSPVIAKAWVDHLVDDINNEMRLRDVVEAQKSIQYLTSQLEEVSVADMRSVFYELVEEQSKIVMFANVRKEYAFKTLDRAVVPERKSKPKKALICILGTFMGGLFSVVIVLGFYFQRIGKSQ